MLYLSRTTDTSAKNTPEKAEVLIQPLYSIKGEKVQDLKCTQKYKVALWRKFLPHISV